MSSNISFAECKFKSWPWDSIKDYAKDIQKLTTEVKSQLSWYSCWNTMWQVEKTLWVMWAWTNKVLDFWWFWSSIEFNMYPIFSWKIPDEFYRDHDFLESQMQKIDDLWTYIWKKCWFSAVPNSKIKELASTYKIKETGNLAYIIVGFRQVNSLATNYFRCNTVPSVWKCINQEGITFFMRL